ncbi:MAG TPA: prefoldin subunit beta [Thermoprotei archaeon]|nr:prefoldin subunit beta [Thermoprotei archaeon]
MRNEIPPRVQHLLKQLNDMQKTYQNITIQKQQIELSLIETKNAIESIKKSTDQYVYRIVGGVFIRLDKGDVLNELEETLKLLQTRVDILSNQEKKLIEDMKKLEEDIQREMGRG